jgi:hypothetical protein
MSRFTATDAQRLKVKARIGLTGATNTGKTYTALVIAAGLLISEGAVDKDGNPDWSKVALIDTERQRSLFYANNGRFGSFKHIDFTPPYTPNDYIDAVAYAESLGVKVCIIDSLSHAWNGTGGLLEYVSEKTEKSRTKNAYNEGWGGKEGGTALQNKMIDAILSCNMHTICTFRQKMEYVQEKDESTGKTIIKKMGVKPVQRDDLEYEFDITLKMDNDHTAEIIKNVVDFLGSKDEKLPVITEEFGTILGDYLNKGKNIDEYKKQLSSSLLENVKSLFTKYPPLTEYYKTKYNKRLSELQPDELRSVYADLLEVIK